MLLLKKNVGVVTVTLLYATLSCFIHLLCLVMFYSDMMSQNQVFFIN